MNETKERLQKSLNELRAYYKARAKQLADDEATKFMSKFYRDLDKRLAKVKARWV